MKAALRMLFFATALYSCNQTKPISEVTETTTGETRTVGNTFGSPFSESNPISISMLQQAIAGKDSVQATVSAEIVESCQAKGCWADVKLPDNRTMKVTFRDYAFFLPVEDLKGRTVVFSGTAKKEVVSVDAQRHYAQDAGKPAAEIAAITQPKEELHFVADGIVLK
ncbi:DUF4920 domain-containing protein [Pontibacter silvestris]|uniref:DUF4920 domain-containing protein n=1 Tax=Pontibacter silvestris TaxID=2305183 RepID=A0ABW4X098_9BACT|nr:DUF4920 domain-containing protein [Pontibacter silvestris]MCC9135998.1 DUF4920 domain-containing protein [Pontibacter silvestris]